MAADPVSTVRDFVAAFAASDAEAMAAVLDEGEVAHITNAQGGADRIEGRVVRSSAGEVTPTVAWAITRRRIHTLRHRSSFRESADGSRSEEPRLLSCSPRPRTARVGSNPTQRKTARDF